MFKDVDMGASALKTVTITRALDTDASGSKTVNDNVYADQEPPLALLSPVAGDK